ncbi:hypothetical protein [Mucilaginibacter sp. dw_454]|uniref:hypothetical protein n=1 Tax=Mucilaginibacter sp. dw_454 TaxID=2720079 RepID=UPI001BD3FC9A|nr:hypothetical protein [Mucilaginibacter sp. dw_454]
MKITFKAFVYAIVFTCFCSAANAQINVPDSLRISLGVNFASTTGNSFGTGVNVATDGTASSPYKFGTGLNLGVEVPVMSSFYLTASAGYVSFIKSGIIKSSQQSITNVPTQNFNTIPLKIGAKLLIGNRFYVAAEAGETLLANKKELYALYGDAFTWAPQIGLVLPLKQHHRYIDAGFRYETTSTFYGDSNHNSFWALRVAYAFNL